MRVGIVGSRNFGYLHLVSFAVSCLCKWDTVVSGQARGVDCVAAAQAVKLGIDCKEFPADWATGRGAGYARNKLIVADSDILLAFWDRQSRGTMHSYRLAAGLLKPRLLVEQPTWVGEVAQRKREILDFITLHRSEEVRAYVETNGGTNTDDCPG